MTSEQFVFWLRGFLSSYGDLNKGVSGNEINKIIEVLNKVEDKQICGMWLKPQD